MYAQDRLNFPSDAKLEDFLIDAITSEVVIGTIDEQKQVRCAHQIRFATVFKSSSNCDDGLLFSGFVGCKLHVPACFEKRDWKTHRETRRLDSAVK